LKKNHNFSKSDIIEVLKKTKIKNGDSIFVHSNIGFFGKLENANNSKEYCEIFKDAIFEVIGEKGTLIVPTFSLSYCNKQIFDKKTTKSFECGVFSEFIRGLKNSKRSDDANFSVSAIGDKSDYFTKKVSKYSFGVNSFWDRLWKENGKICRFNMGPDYNTFIHFVERKLNVKYRYDKGFSGTSTINNKKIKNEYYHYAHDLENQNHLPNLTKLDNKCRELGFLKSKDLGRGQIIVVSAIDVYNVINQEIKKDMSFLIKGNI